MQRVAKEFCRLLAAEAPLVTNPKQGSKDRLPQVGFAWVTHIDTELLELIFS